MWRLGTRKHFLYSVHVARDVCPPQFVTWVIYTHDRYRALGLKSALRRLFQGHALLQVRLCVLQMVSEFCCNAGLAVVSVDRFKVMKLRTQRARLIPV